MLKLAALATCIFLEMPTAKKKNTAPVDAWPMSNHQNVIIKSAMGASATLCGLRQMLQTLFAASGLWIFATRSEYMKDSRGPRKSCRRSGRSEQVLATFWRRWEEVWKTYFPRPQNNIDENLTWHRLHDLGHCDSTCEQSARVGRAFGKSLRRHTETSMPSHPGRF